MNDRLTERVKNCEKRLDHHDELIEKAVSGFIATTLTAIGTLIVVLIDIITRR